KPHQRQPASPESPDQGNSPEENQQKRRHRRPPLLLERVGAEEDQAVLLDDEAPAGAVRLAAGLRVRTPHRIQNCPVDQRRQDFPQNEQDQNRRRASGQVWKQVLAQPDGPGEAGPCPHRARIRALYQFISAEIEWLIVRYTAMMIATP